jgi:peptide/nickel transport system ATP-binding protein/oligopeptide transport system ATP-binding protein
MTIRKIILEPLLTFPKKVRDEKGSKENLVKLIKSVGLQEQHLDRYPHEFSGGQRQRIAVARAIITDPEVLILDEPTSALDVSVQAQILNLLKDIQKERNMTYLFISHNMAVVRYISNRVGVLYKGEFVEMGDSSEVFNAPKHNYTKKLISSILD